MESNPTGPGMAIANALKPKSGPPRIAHTTIQHHNDGTHTVTHTNEDGSTHPNSGAASDLDGVHDRLEDNLSEGA